MGPWWEGRTTTTTTTTTGATLSPTRWPLTTMQASSLPWQASTNFLVGHLNLTVELLVYPCQTPGEGTTSGPHPTAGPTDPPQPTDPTNPTNPTNPPEPQGGSISNPQTGLCLAVDSQVIIFFVKF